MIPCRVLHVVACCEEDYRLWVDGLQCLLALGIESAALVSSTGLLISLMCFCCVCVNALVVVAAVQVQQINCLTSLSLFFVGFVAWVYFPTRLYFEVVVS